MIAGIIGLMSIPPSAPQDPMADRVDRIQVDYKATDPNRHKVTVWRGNWNTSMIVFDASGIPTDTELVIQSQGDWRKADNTAISAQSKLFLRRSDEGTFLRFEVYDSVQLHKRIFYIPETPVSLVLDVR